MSKKSVKKVRADQLLCRQGHCATAQEAAILIMAGNVRLNADHVIKNASVMIPEDTVLEVEAPCPYVSRGAFKLRPALEKYLPRLDGKVGLDIGASTGGFTDLMLQSGAVRVYTVDSGRGQLHDRIRRDPRVISHEQTSARNLPPDFIPEPIDLITMDVSFISATALLSSAAQFLKAEGYAFILVKPQFEAPRHQVGSGGVVRDETVIGECIAKVIAAAGTLRWRHLDTIASPITGPKGNQEYVCVFRSASSEGR